MLVSGSDSGDLTLTLVGEFRGLDELLHMARVVATQLYEENGVVLPFFVFAHDGKVSQLDTPYDTDAVKDQVAARVRTLCANLGAEVLIHVTQAEFSGDMEPRILVTYETRSTAGFFYAPVSDGRVGAWEQEEDINMDGRFMGLLPKTGVN